MTKDFAMTDPVDLDNYLDFKSAVSRLPDDDAEIVLALVSGHSLVHISKMKGVSILCLKKEIIRIFMFLNNTVPVVMWIDFLDALHEAEFPEDESFSKIQ